MRRWSVGLFLALWAATAAYGWSFLDHGWIPHDEGTLAHPAERVLAGELPHRDFDDTYTGALAMVNALALQVFGESLMSIRYALFVVFLLWIPAVWYLATRLVSPLLAVLITALAAALTIPNYPAAMPSWYNLFLACFALAGLVRWVETDQRRWLFLAGAAVGLSIITKIVGLYMLAGALVGVLLVDQEVEPDPAEEAGSGGGQRVLSVAATGAALILVYLVVDLVASHSGLRELYHYVLPTAGISALVIVREWLRPPEAFAVRAQRLGSRVGPLLAGVLLPVAVFLVPYALSGGLDELYHGVFVAPRRRLTFAAFRPPSLSSIPYAVAVVALTGLACRLRGRARWGAAVALAMAGAYLLIARGPQHYFPVWFSLQGLTPVLVLVGFVLLMKPAGAEVESPRRTDRAITLLLLAPLSLMGLLQFPFAVPVYFLYFAPLVILAGVALARLASVEGPAVGLGSVAGFFLLFLALYVNGGSSLDMMLRPARDLESSRLEMARANLRVNPGHKQTWERVSQLLTQHAGGAPIYAAPDAPELYFLTGLENPTRSLFDFLGEPDEGSDVLGVLEREGVLAVAINEGPSFSDPMDQALRNELERRYPRSEQVAHFQVRWKE